MDIALNRYSKMGKISGAKAREKSIAAYNESPNICLYCGSVIQVKGKQRVSAVRKKKFCDHKCSGRAAGARLHKLTGLAIGDKHSRLTVVGEVYRQDRKSFLYECICECGGKATVRGSQLKAGTVRSCGCLMRETMVQNGKNTKLPDGIASRNKIIRRYKRGARQRKLSFELTNDELIALFESSCAYCGKEPSQVAFNDTGKAPASGPYVYTGIDRIDNDVGYATDNACACCSTCNMMKRSLGLTEFKAAVSRIARHLGLLDESLSMPGVRILPPEGVRRVERLGSEPDKRAGARWKRVRPRKGLGCNTSALRAN